MDITKCRENFGDLTAFLTPLLEAEFSPPNKTVSVPDTESQTFSKTSLANDSIENTLNTMKSRYAPVNIFIARLFYLFVLGSYTAIKITL